MIKIRGKEGDVERLQGQVESPKWKVKKVRTDNKARNAVDGGGKGGGERMVAVVVVGLGWRIN